MSDLNQILDHTRRMEDRHREAIVEIRRLRRSLLVERCGPPELMQPTLYSKCVFCQQNLHPTVGQKLPVYVTVYTETANGWKHYAHRGQCPQEKL